MPRRVSHSDEGSSQGAPGSTSSGQPAAPTHPILVIDDHELFSGPLTTALRDLGHDARRLIIADLDSIVADAGRSPAGLALLDLHLGHDAHGRCLDGVTLVAPLRALGWGVLIVSGSRDASRTAAAIAAGALGTVPKSSSFERLLHAIRTAAAGGQLMTDRERDAWLLRHHGHQREQRALADRLDRLSQREREVLQLLAEGSRAAGIADQLVVSLSTVRTQIRAILTKLDVGSQLEAVALLSRHRPV
jgi:DNA-binding NarL/FixJ family response regulator